MKKLISALAFAGLELSVAAQAQTVGSTLEWATKAAADKSMAVAKK